MKQILTFLLVMVVCAFAQSQESKWPALDASSLDAEYYPAEAAYRNYLPEEQRNLSPKIKVLYSRPMMKGRKIFGEMIKYGEEWRLGANEATMITFYQPVSIGETTVNQGTYTLSVIPTTSTWTFNFSTEMGIWGSANRDKSKTIASVTVPSTFIGNAREILSMTFQTVDDQTANLVVEWENTRVILPIGFNPIMFNGADPSPMDMAHYPENSAFNNYAKTEDDKLEPIIVVTYGRPQKKGREIFGGMLNDGDVWRIGANEATEVVFYKDVKVGDTSLKAGRYVMFAKLDGATWDIIFSKDFPIWGAANRDESKDVATASVPVTKEKEVVEALSIIFEEKSATSAHMIIGWDTTRAAIPVSW